MNARTSAGALSHAVNAVVLIAALLAVTADAAALAPAEERGKQIFLTGKSPAGREITAYVGQASTPLPASALPCVSCHGPDGLGRPEGGVTPANITWSHLTKSYGTVSSTGRPRPAYTEETVARAVAAGIDSRGVRFDVSMPRFQMHAEDMADLVAYLKRLEHELDPGLTETAITLGTLLPEGGRTASLGDAIEGVILAYFADINAQGGIYNRRLELKATSAPTRDLVLARGEALIESGEVFALVAAVSVGVESELDVVVEQHGIPLIGPFTQFPASAEAMRRFTFYLYGGLAVQAQALSQYASTKLVPSGAKIGVVYPRDGKIRAVAQAIQAQAKRRQWPAPVVVEYPGRRMDAAAVAAKLKSTGTEALLFLGRGAELRTLAAEGVQGGWTPYVLTPGALAGDVLFDLPAAFQGRVFLAYPTGPSDYTRAGAGEFNAFRRRHDLSRQHTSAQIAAYAAVKLLAEGLKAAGRSLSREKLVQALEKLYEFETGLTPKITYGPNRRIGALGAHIVALDLEKRTVVSGSEWIAPDE
jgi:ABC-type branched-subunit amino acid transport system substrate-binding protein